VLADEASGALTAAPAPGQAAAVTAYLAATAGAPRRRAWLPLWRWAPGARELRVWDYSGGAARVGARGAELDPRLPAEAAGARGRGGGGGAGGGRGRSGGGAAHTVHVFPCEQPAGEGPPLLAILGHLQALTAAAAGRGAEGAAAARDPLRPLASATAFSYTAAGAPVAVRLAPPPAAAAAWPSSSSAPAATARGGLAVELSLRAEAPRAGAGPPAPPALVGTLQLDASAGSGSGGGASEGPGGSGSSSSRHAGSYDLTLIRSGNSAAAAHVAGALPEWAAAQLRAADRAARGSSRALPPLAALLTSAAGEQWLVCCDALPTASIAANLGHLWPRQPQGLRCWHRRAAPQPAARPDAPAQAPGGEPAAAAPAAARAPAQAAAPANAGQPKRPQAGKAASLRTMVFVSTPLGPPAALTAGGGVPVSSSPEQSEAGAAAAAAAAGSAAPRSLRGSVRGGGRGPKGGSSGSRSSSGGISQDSLAAAAARWTAQSGVPDWAAAALAVIAVPWAPHACAAPWHVPAGAAPALGRGAGRWGSVAALTAGLPDSGISRAFLWWAWNQGSEGLNKVLAPPAPPGADGPGGGGGGAARSWAAPLRRWLGGRRAGAGGQAAAAASASARPLSPVLDGLLVTTVEELVLRAEPLLGPYWRARSALDGPGAAAAVRGADVPLLQVSAGRALLLPVCLGLGRCAYSSSEAAEARCH
jgi:hypothetical protein